MAVMNIELGKKIFFKCYGNAFGIQREYGKEYKKCKIPRKYEIEWLDEIKNQLYEAINNSSGNKRYSNFIKLCDIISLNAAIELTCKFLETNLDYFERLLYTEYLKLLNKKVNSHELLKKINENKFILKNNINLVKKDSKLYITLKEREIEERIKRL
ncbi:MAG TPA: hypothetical protein DCX39_05260 [Firmicutes bacterium]|nr:hypothetical protein [Bacillota bacterium]HAX00544.1 hypothetical protein [Bacillota bacterium]